MKPLPIFAVALTLALLAFAFSAHADRTLHTFKGDMHVTFSPDGGGRLVIDAPLKTPLRTLSTCAASIEGQEEVDVASGGLTSHKTTHKCFCTSDGKADGGSVNYKWMNLGSGNLGTTTTCPD